MQKLPTFKDIVQQTFFHEIKDKVSLFINGRFRNMEFHSNQINIVDKVQIQEQSLQRIIAYDSIDDTLYFDAVVTAEILIFQFMENIILEDIVKNWFRVSCAVDVSEGFVNYRIIKIENNYNYHENYNKNILDDYLIPVISTAKLDKYAEEILWHVYPEALETPMPIDVKKFAERLDLKIECKRISRNGTIFGEIIFYPTSVDHYNLNRCRFSTYEAERGTIFADEEAFFLRSLGCWNNTIIHECVHWLKHRKHIELVRAAGGDLSRISCQVAESGLPTNIQGRTENDWMEWHSNALAPRILMPHEPFKQKAEKLIALYMKNGTANNLSEIISEVIMDLHKFFNVSVQSAKIRMVDIDYKEAIGVLEYVDGHYVKPYHPSSRFIDRHQTFTIPIKDCFILYTSNPVFRNIIDSGNFVHVDSHFCINAQKYVTQNSHGILEMTEYATFHMDECCLTFERVYKENPDFGLKHYEEGILYQSAVKKQIPEFNYYETEENKRVVNLSATLQADLDEAKNAAKIMFVLPPSFGKSLVMLMEWKEVTVEKLCECSQLTPKMIQRMRTDSDQVWEIRKVIAVCIGLGLPPYISNSLITKAGLSFKPDEEQVVFQYLLNSHYKSTIHDCNELLIVAGYHPLNFPEK